MHRTLVKFMGAGADSLPLTFPIDLPGTEVQQHVTQWIGQAVSATRAGSVANLLGDHRNLAAWCFGRSLSVVGDRPVLDVNQTDTITVTCYSPNIAPKVEIREGLSEEAVEQAFAEMAAQVNETISSTPVEPVEPSLLEAFKIVLRHIVVALQDDGAIDAYIAMRALGRVAAMDEMPTFSGKSALRLFKTAGLVFSDEIKELKDMFKAAKTAVEDEEDEPEDDDDSTPGECASSASRRTLKGYVDQAAEHGLVNTSDAAALKVRVDNAIMPSEVPDGLPLMEALSLFRRLNLITSTEEDMARRSLSTAPIPVQSESTETPSSSNVEEARRILGTYVDFVVARGIVGEYEVGNVRRRISAWDGTGAERVSDGWDIEQALDFMSGVGLVSSDEERYIRPRV